MNLLIVFFPQPLSPLQADIFNLQNQFQHTPQSTSIDQSFEVLGFIQGKVPEPALFPSCKDTSLAQPQWGDSSLLEDLVALGDGGIFMDRVITPVFVVISYEVCGKCNINNQGNNVLKV